jgi:alkylated DNA nucleotide flippase Atl1
MKPKTTWQAKLHKPAQVEVKEGPEAWNNKFGGDRMLIATPLEIDKIVRAIPEGRVMTIPELRQELAEAFDADYTCPLTTGIFFRIVAEASEEMLAEGKTDRAPWWRTVGEKGELNPKLPGYPEKQIGYLEQEGWKVRQKGKKYFLVFP